MLKNKLRIVKCMGKKDQSLVRMYCMYYYSLVNTDTSLN